MSHAPHDQALLVMAHGSRDAEARKEYRRIHRALAERMAPTPVVFAILEFAGDDGLLSIEDGWRQCVESGAKRVVGLPFFLFPAGHVREDLPRELREAREAGGWAELDLLPPLGAADELLTAVQDRAGEAAGSDTSTATALVLVGAGTSDPDANGDLCKAARLLWESAKGQYELVETAWVSLTRPTVSEAVDRCVRLGAERIALVPYFLNTGVLLKRIDERLEEIRPAYPAVQISRGAHIGLHPRLLDLLERRARDGLERSSESRELMAVCGRPSCSAIAAGRDRLLRVDASLR